MKKIKLNNEIDRKNFLMASTGLLATAMLSGLSAETMQGGETGHEHHMHHGAAKNSALITAAVDCLAKAEICINHCILSLKEKDLSLVDCLSTAREMVPLCNGLSTMAANESKYLAEYAAICMKACEDCMKECKKHAEKHKTCADCADACKVCIDECKKVA